MADDAPFCNVAIPSPPGDPKKKADKLQLQRVPPNININHFYNIVNNNFNRIENFINNLKPASFGSLKETKRDTVQVRVENPDDSEQYVLVEQIDSLDMKDTKNGEKWTWKRN